MKKIKLVGILLVFLFEFRLAFAAIPSPEQFLGFKPGTAKKLATMQQIIDYFKILDAGSDRILVEEIGKTTNKNPFIVAYISSEENMKHLDLYKKYQQLLADPRKISDADAEKIIVAGKTIVMINCSIHATEIGASQMSLQLAFDLATQTDDLTKEILDNTIVLFTPMHNPDGIQMVVDWYKKYLDTKYEGSSLPWLYHKYVGHDNNRDWYMFTQVETQLTLKVHNDWHPQIVVDMHQMGSQGARLFVPPYVDPFEPNVDPILQQEVAMLGTFIASELTAQGKAGVIHSDRFDAWTPARAYHHYHGGVRILTECASVQIASPVILRFESLPTSVQKPSVSMPLPWQGGDWRLQDIVDYDYAAAKAALVNAARLRENWLRNFYLIFKNAVNGKKSPFAFLIPAQQKDLSSTINMLNILQMGQVEINQAKNDFKLNEQFYPAGTFIIYVGQPFGSFAKTLLEKQVYPEIRIYPGGPLKTPYDVVAHTLPLLMGVDVFQADSSFEIETVIAPPLEKPVGKIENEISPFGYVWDHSSNDDIVALNRLIKNKYNVFWSSDSFCVNQKVYPAGAMIVKNGPGLAENLKNIAQDLYVHFEALKPKPEVDAYALKPVRLGLYKSWTASMDEGWTRWVLEQHEFNFKSLFDRDIRNGKLDKSYDVIIFPDMDYRQILDGNSERIAPPEYAGGITKIGAANIKKFVEKGGTIILLNSAADFAIREFDIAVSDSSKNLNRRAFYIPGSILKVLVDNRHPIAYGYDKETALFFRRSPVFQLKTGASVLTYPDTNPLLSGWVNGANHLFNKSALVDVPVEDGKVILIGFPAQYRAQSHETFGFLFNAIYYGAAERNKL